MGMAGAAAVTAMAGDTAMARAAATAAMVRPRVWLRRLRLWRLRRLSATAATAWLRRLRSAMGYGWHGSASGWAMAATAATVAWMAATGLRRLWRLRLGGYGGYGGYGLGYGGLGSASAGTGLWRAGLWPGWLRRLGLRLRRSLLRRLWPQLLDYGPSLYDWGYASYYNPYSYGLHTGMHHDRRRAAGLRLHAADQHPGRAARSGREQPGDHMLRLGAGAFKAGNYPQALELTDQAIRQMPNDAALHEFRAWPCSPCSSTTSRRPRSTRC